MIALTEDDIEQNLIKLLEKQGYEYVHDSKLLLVHEGTQTGERKGFDNIILESRFKNALKKTQL